jgi:site-specific DNA recombinase
MYPKTEIDNYPKPIKNVAIYLRKSREDLEEEDTLGKHRSELIPFVESKGWKYELFEEIGSSDTIKYRKEFSKMLERIELGMYDAVVSMHFDRLTRGDSFEVGLIKKILKESNTIVISPRRTWDFSQENLLNEVELLIARQELIRNKERLREGKVRSAKLGHWVNGSAPFGYDYDHKTKKLVINEEKAKIVKDIYEWYLEGMAMFEIGHELNRRGKKTNNGAYFQDATISRILTNEVYIGNIIYGKSEGSGHKNKKTTPLIFKDASEWEVYVENAHPPIISKEDFEKVKKMMSKRTRVPTKARSGSYALSGLLFCGKCGKAVRFNRKTLKKGEVVYAVKCQSSDPFGNRCGNAGIEVKDLLSEIEIEVDQYFQQLNNSTNSTDKSVLKKLERELKTVKAEISKLEGSKDRIKDLYIDGMIDKEEFKKRTDKNEKELDKARHQLKQLEGEHSETENESLKERLKRLKEFKKNFSIHGDEKQTNEALKNIIKKVSYIRNEDNVTLDIHFM